jgi:hypothetical protein
VNREGYNEGTHLFTSEKEYSSWGIDGCHARLYTRGTINRGKREYEIQCPAECVCKQRRLALQGIGEGETKTEEKENERGECVRPMISPPSLRPMPSLAGSSFWTERTRVSPMRCVDEIPYSRIVEIGGRFPSVLLLAIVQPLYQVLHSSLSLSRSP